MSTSSQIWLKEEKTDFFLKSVAFLISPVLGLLAALPRLNTRSSFLVFLLSLTLFGLTMIVPEHWSEKQNLDAIVYRSRFESAINTNMHDLPTYLQTVRAYEGNTSTDIDAYDRVLAFIVAHLSDNYHVYFMFVALIYTGFMLKSMRYLVSEDNYTFSVTCLILLFFFTASQIYLASVVRFFTALWIAVYAFFRIFIDHRKTALLWLCITPFVHASFFIIFPILCLWLVIRKSNRMAFTLVAASFLLSAFAVQLLSLIVAVLPDGMSAHYSSYLNAWYIQKINEGGSGYIWVVRIFEFAVRLSINLAAAYMAWRYKEHILGTKAQPLYFLMLAFIAFCNFTFMVPSVGSRFFMFVFPLFAYIWLVCFSSDSAANHRILYPFAGLYLFFFFFLPWSIYLLPALRPYAALWNSDILLMSPFYLIYHYML